MKRIETINNEDFKDCIQVTLKIHEFYYPQKENSFWDIKPCNDKILQVMTGFVKFIQSNIESSNSKIIIRYWRDFNNKDSDAFTIAVSGCVHSTLNHEFDHFRTKKIEGIKYYYLLYLYDCLCNAKMDEHCEEQDLDTLLNFTNAFSYENTKEYLSDGKFEPVYDFEVRKHSYFYWEAFSRAVFPWYCCNEFEKAAAQIMKNIRKDRGETILPAEKLSLLALEYGDERTDLINEEEAEDAEVKKKKKDYTNKSYFDKRKKWMKKKSKNRVFNLTQSKLGTTHSDYKEPLYLLNKCIENFDPKTEQDEINKIYSGFWKSTAAHKQLSYPVISMYREFCGKRKSSPFMVLDPTGGVIRNVLENIFQGGKSIMGIKNNIGQFFFMLVGRDSSCNPLDRMGFHVMVSGSPGTGKTYIVGVVDCCSASGTILQNSIDASAKADFVGQNMDEFAMNVMLDAGPIWYKELDKLPIDQQQKLRAIITKLSESKQRYKVFNYLDDPNGIMDPHERRTSIWADSSHRGSHVITGNYPSVVSEVNDRVLPLTTGHDMKDPYSNVYSSKMAKELMEMFASHNKLQEWFFSWFKEIQADVAMYMLFKTCGASPLKSFNIIGGVFVSSFCIENLAKRLPFFNNSSRKFTRLFYLATTLKSYTIKTVLCNMEGSKYYGKERIEDVGEYCYDFDKRMIIGYEEIVPAMFMMLPQYIDSTLWEILTILKDYIFKIDTNNPVTYFNDTIKSERNQMSDYDINFRLTQSDNGDANYSQGLKINSNFLEYRTKLTKEDFARLIIKHMKTSMPVEVVLAKLDELKKEVVRVDEPFKILIDKGFYTDPNLVINFESSNTVEEFKCLRVDWKKDIRETTYIMPWHTFSLLQKSPYEVLKDIIQEDLPYRNQGKKLDVVAVRVPEMELEMLQIDPANATRRNFTVRNPKVMSMKERQFYSLAKTKYNLHNQEDNNDNESLFEDLISKKTLVFDHPLIDLGITRHQEAFNLSDAEMKELLEEEEKLMDFRYEDDLSELVKEYKQGIVDLDIEMEGEEEDY